MVRCGVVAHPRDWPWVGYHEIIGQRQRYRLGDLERLCWRLRAGSLDELRKNLAASLAEKIAQADAKREPCWTESLPVGSLGFLEKAKPLILSRRETEIVESADDKVWRALGNERLDGLAGGGVLGSALSEDGDHRLALAQLGQAEEALSDL